MTPEQGFPGSGVKARPHFAPRHIHLEKGKLFLLYPKMICGLEQPYRGGQTLLGPARIAGQSVDPWGRDSEDISRHKDGLRIRAEQQRKKEQLWYLCKVRGQGCFLKK